MNATLQYEQQAGNKTNTLVTKSYLSDKTQQYDAQFAEVRARASQVQSVNGGVIDIKFSSLINTFIGITLFACDVLEHTYF